MITYYSDTKEDLLMNSKIQWNKVIREKTQ